MTSLGKTPLLVNNVLDHAIDLARRGILVFPMIAAEKRPGCAHGVKDATRDPDTLRRWFVRPGIIPAIATGEVSGISVLDIDTPAGLPWWTENRHRLPATFTYRTRSGGLHLWFRHSPGLKSSVAVIAPGIDVRSTGASAIYWPAAGFPVLAGAPPTEWHTSLQPPSKPAPLPTYEPHDARHPEHVEAALAGLIRNVALAGQGERNARLHWSACRAAEMTARGEISRGNVEAVLIEAASRCGLDSREAAATIASAYRAGGR